MYESKGLQGQILTRVLEEKGIILFLKMLSNIYLSNVINVIKCLSKNVYQNVIKYIYNSLSSEKL